MYCQHCMVVYGSVNSVYLVVKRDREGYITPFDTLSSLFCYRRVSVFDIT